MIMPRFSVLADRSQTWFGPASRIALLFYVVLGIDEKSKARREYAVGLNSRSIASISLATGMSSYG